MIALGRLTQTICLLTLGAAAVALVGYHFLTSRFDDELRIHLVRVLRQRFPEHIVTIRTARRLPGTGIELQSLSIAAPVKGHADRQLVYVEELLLGCDTDFAKLLTGETHLSGVKLRGVKVRATRAPDGTWDVSPLLQKRSEKFSCPGVTITDATVDIVDHKTDTPTELTLRNFDLSIYHSDDETNPDDETHSDDVAHSSKASQSEDKYHVRGSFSTNIAPRVLFEGWFADDAQNWALETTANGVELSSKLGNHLSADYEGLLSWINKSSGLADIHARVSFHSERDRRPQFKVTGKLYDGRIEHPLLPYAFSQVAASFVASNESLKIEQATARHDDTEFLIAGEVFGYSASSPVQLRASAKRLQLDRRLGNSMPPRVQLGWQKFQPAGTVNAELDVSFDGSAWHSNLRLDCVDVSFMYERFRYRFDGGRGVLLFADDSLVMKDFQALANGRAVQIDAEFQRLGPDVTGWMECLLRDPIPLDEKIVVALDEKTQKAVRSLNPGGQITAWGRLERVNPVDRFTKTFKIGLQNCWFTYDHFRYPLHQVNGVIEVTNEDWSFEKLTGQNDTAYVECDGRWIAQREGGGHLALNFVAWDVPLEEELRNALGAKVQRVWTALRPHGTIDHMNIAVRYDSLRRDLVLDIMADKWPPQQNIEGRSLRIEPEWFPYAMENVTGTVRYRNGLVELHDMKALHGQTKLAAKGLCEFAPDGRWSLRLSQLLADRVHVNHELTTALPGRLGQAIDKLNLTGPVNIDSPPSRPGHIGQTGREALALYGGPGEPVTAAWNLLFDVENGNIDCGVKLQHIHGSTTLTGNFDGRKFRSRGELSIDSLTYRDIQATQIRGPFEVNDASVTFGAWLPPTRAEEAPRQITATTLRGALAGDAQVSLTDDVAFRLEGSLFNADLADATREVTSQPTDLSGRMFGSLRLSGTCKGVHTFRGDGQVELTEANIYELPVMVRMLKLLRIREPDESAFTSSDIRFRVEGDRIYFDEINFHGDVISLREGTGEMDLQRHVNLQFYTMVGRDELPVPLLQVLLREASPRILMLHITGTLDDPQVTRELFPEVNEKLKEIFPEATERRPAATSQRPRGMLDLKTRR